MSGPVRTCPVKADAPLWGHVRRKDGPMTHLGDLKPDPRNARKHTPRNQDQIARSIQRNGFGRSILLASDGTIIAGNATADAAGSIGLEDVLVIESDGRKVIAIKRTDVEPGSPEFHELAIADNRAAELATWDLPVLAELAGDIDLGEFWLPDEWDTLVNGAMPEDATAAAGAGDEESERQPVTCPSCGHQF